MATLPKLGEKKTFKPQSFENGLPVELKKEVTGTVVWIHPKGRYYLVEVSINGNTWRETMYPEN